ncbi:uncharacterized protein LOC142228579 [Haematobia irritans]|uniref:uncharacterized protein LOC142228579 n=1 Tax=Haematobia irritans TaxID=7368 RepID=UPI003F50CB5C
MQKIRENLNRIQTKIHKTLTEDELQEFYTCEKTLETNIKLKIKKRHQKKFKSLQTAQLAKLNITVNDDWFVNKTNTNIPDNIKWLLSHGKKFGLPNVKENFPLLKYIADGEECIKTIGEKDDQEIARNKLTSMLENHMNKQQLNARGKYTVNAMKHTKNFLKQNKNIAILEADKGNVTVAMKRDEYEEKMDRIVNDMMTYKRLQKDPTNTLQKKNNDLVNELFRQNIISEFERKRMKTDTAVAPRIYGLPKIHKEGYPLRPICSSINSPASELCKYITSILKNLTVGSKFNIKNSMEFKEKINKTVIEEDETMFSLDR